jgi:sulfoxide reductase heme-binding subunit YedZ
MNWLGTPVWKFVQQGTYVLWWLSVVHTGYFLYLHFLDFHRNTPDPNWLQWPFVGLVGVVLILQVAASAATWRKGRPRTTMAPESS